MRYFFVFLQNDKTRSSASEGLISDIKFQNMFEDLIFRILGTEPSFVSNRQESATPDVIENCSPPHKPSPKKYRKDIEALQERYGNSFSTGFLPVSKNFLPKNYKIVVLHLLISPFPFLQKVRPIFYALLNVIPIPCPLMIELFWNE